MQEVEYIAAMKNDKQSAEFVKKIPNGTIEGKEIHPEIYNGVVIRSVRCLSPDQEDYCSLIAQKDATGHEFYEIDQPTFQFSMISLNDLHDFVHKDDLVTFQIATLKDGQKIAVNVKPEREKHQVRFYIFF